MRYCSECVGQPKGLPVLCLCDACGKWGLCNEGEEGALTRAALVGGALREKLITEPDEAYKIGLKYKDRAKKADGLYPGKVVIVSNPTGPSPSPFEAVTKKEAMERCEFSSDEVAKALESKFPEPVIINPSNRLGRFSISLTLAASSPYLLKSILLKGKCELTGSYEEFDTGRTIYAARSEFFDELPPGVEIPMYGLMVAPSEDMNCRGYEFVSFVRRESRESAVNEFFTPEPEKKPASLGPEEYISPWWKRYYEENPR